MFSAFPAAARAGPVRTAETDFPARPQTVRVAAPSPPHFAVPALPGAAAASAADDAVLEKEVVHVLHVPCGRPRFPARAAGPDFPKSWAVRVAARSVAPCTAVAVVSAPAEASLCVTRASRPCCRWSPWLIPAGPRCRSCSPARVAGPDFRAVPGALTVLDRLSASGPLWVVRTFSPGAGRALAKFCLHRRVPRPVRRRCRVRRGPVQFDHERTCRGPRGR